MMVLRTTTMRLCTTLANPGEQIHHCNEDIGHCSGEIHLLRAILSHCSPIFHRIREENERFIEKIERIGENRHRIIAVFHYRFERTILITSANAHFIEGNGRCSLFLALVVKGRKRNTAVLSKIVFMRIDRFNIYRVARDTEQCNKGLHPCGGAVCFQEASNRC